MSRGNKANTQQRKTKVIALLRSGKTLEEITRNGGGVGLSASTVQRWRKADRWFDQQVKGALQATATAPGAASNAIKQATTPRPKKDWYERGEFRPYM